MTRLHDILNLPMAVISIVSPLWLPLLEKVSQFAALMIPIVVFAYWTLMIGWKIYDRFKANRP